MKKLFAIYFAAVTALCLHTTVKAAESASTTETSVEVVPLGKTTGDSGNMGAGFVVTAAWEDGSDYKPLIFLTAAYGGGYAALQKAEALIDAAIRAEETVRFFLRRTVAESFLNGFVFDRLAFRGTTINLLTGKIETEGPKQKVAQASAPAGTPIEVCNLEASEVPGLLTDYTVQGNIRLGVREETYYITLFLGSWGYAVVQAEKAGGRAIKLYVQATTTTPRLPEKEVLLTFNHEVSPKRIRMTSIRGERTLDTAVNKLIRDVRDGDVKAPMLQAMLTSTK